MAVAFHGSFLCSPLKQIPGTTSFTLGGAWQWRQMSEMGCCVPDPFLGLSLGLRIGTEFGEQYPVGVLSVRCASKSATRVLQEVVSVGGTNGAKLLVRRSRGLSRVAQMEVLEELVQRGQCELVLPVSLSTASFVSGVDVDIFLTCGSCAFVMVGFHRNVVPALGLYDAERMFNASRGNHGLWDAHYVSQH